MVAVAAPAAFSPFIPIKKVEARPVNPFQAATDRTQLTRGYSVGLLSALILSTTAILMRHLNVAYHMPPLVLAFWRDGMVALTLLAVLAVVRPLWLRGTGQHRLYLLAYGLLLAVFNAMWAFSVALNGAAVSTVLAYSSAGFTAMLGWWLLKERLGWVKIVAVLFSLGGCALVSGALDPAAWQTNLPGIVTGILTGLCYAGYSLMGRSAAQRGMNTWTTLLHIFAFAAFFLLLFNLLPGVVLPANVARPANLFWLGNSLAGWIILFLLAAGPSLTGYGLYNVSLEYLPSSVANLIVSTEPVFTAIIAYLLLGERLTLIQLGGGLLILTAVVLLRRYDRE